MESGKKVIQQKISQQDADIMFLTQNINCSEVIKEILIEENKKKKKVLNKKLNKGMVKKTVKRVSKVKCIFFI